MKSNKEFIILLEILVITFLVMSVVPVCGLSDSSADISAYLSIVNPGDEITVTYSGAPGFYWDYIAIYKVGEQDIYEQCELGGVIHLLEGKKSGTLIFTAPDEPGDYVFRLFENDGYTDIARSNVVTVQEGTTSTTPPPTAEGGLVAYYTFDGDTLDHSENENNGTNHGATFVSGISGQALSFDGKDDYVQVPDSPSLDIASNNITLSAWVYFPEFVPGYGTVIEKTGSDGWNSYGVFSKNDKLSFWLYKESIEAHIAMSANQWVHFVATYDGINMKIYINGALDVEREQPGIDIKENNMPLMIGADPFDGGDYCHILIDEVKIYNYALSADEIKAHYDEKEPSATSSTPTTTPDIPSTGDELPPPVEEIQFDFNDGRAQNWLDDGSGCWAVSDGAYVMTGNNGGIWRYSYYDHKFCDFEFQVDMRKLCGDSSENNFSYGISFRSDGTMDNRYSFTISKGGGYCIGKSVNGTSTKIKDWTKSSALNAGFEHWNTLRVVAKGSSLKFYANGILLHDIQDTAFSCGLVGLPAYDPAKSDCPDTVQFDKVTWKGSIVR